MNHMEAFLISIVRVALSALIASTLTMVVGAEASMEPLDAIQTLLEHEKYSEALTKARELQKARPDDAELKDLIAQLEPLAVPAPASSKSSSDTAGVPADDDKLLSFQRKVLESTMADALNAEPDSAEYRKLFAQAFEQTTALVKDSPENLWLWTVRAMAAFELGKPKDGWLAGMKMRQLDAEYSTDEFTVDVLVSLAKEGWLEKKEPDVSAVTPEGGIGGVASATTVSKKTAGKNGTATDAGKKKPAGGGGSSIRSAIEMQYKRGFITKEQYLNAIRNL
jgi:hypothetical protein